MKHYLHFFHAATAAIALTIAAFASSACSSHDDGPRVTPTLPCTSHVPVRSITHDGTVVTGYDWRFTYADGRLTQATGVKRDAQQASDGQYTYTSTIDYGHNNQLSVRNSSGENIDVTLNAEGLIRQMVVNRNKYEFSYAEGRLASWKITIYEGTFGHAQEFVTTGILNYENGDLTHIVYTGADKAPVEVTIAPSEMQNVNGLLPETLSKEMGVMGYEHLYYAGLFGRASQHLPATIARHFTATPASDYTVRFSYSHVNGNTKLCSYENGGQPTVASYGY